MTPPKKRQKKQEAKDKEKIDMDAMIEGTPPLMFADDSILQLMMIAQDLQEPSDAESNLRLASQASIVLLKIKSEQRKLFGSIHAMQATLQEQKRHDSKHLLKLENLTCLKDRYQEMIPKSSTVDQSNLLKLSCDELGISQPEGDDAQQEAIRKYLEADHEHTSQQSHILKKLDNELLERKEMGTELERLNRQNENLAKSLSLKQKLLNGLLPKLKEIERSSLGLQKFCHKSFSKTSPSLLMTGTKRQQRIEKAQSLPSPLYTVYYQLQMYIDTTDDFKTHAALDDDDSKSKDAQIFLEINGNENWLELHVPIPVINTEAAVSLKARKMAKIRFAIQSESSFMTAVCPERFGMKGLIDELFPGDTGEKTSAFMAAKGTLKNMSTNVGRPYQWCNYLAGIHVPPESPTDRVVSTKVIVQAIVKRVRALATLDFQLSLLEKKVDKFPVHPALIEKFQQGEKENDCYRIDGNQFSIDVTKQSFTKESEASDSSVEAYKLSLKHTKRGQLYLRVEIDFSLYPVKPPKWTASSMDDSKPGSTVGKRTTRLYDEFFANLEHRVNEGVHFFVTDDETTYDWILNSQLASIVCWWSSRE